MTIHKLGVDGLVTEMKADIDMAPFRRDSVHRRPSSHPSTYEADILFAFTSLTKWVLQTITEMGEKVKSSKSFRYVSFCRL